MRAAIVGAMLLTACTTVLAQVKVDNPWVRATVAQQKTSSAYMSLTAASAVRVVEVTSMVAGAAEIHETKMENNMMKMRAVPALELPSGRTVELKPGGLHIMLVDLRQPLKEGEMVALTLTVERSDKKRETVVVRAPVRGLTTESMKGHAH